MKLHLHPNHTQDMQYHLKKSLGQHFLKDATVIDKILRAVYEVAPQRLLEVGPGGGALTRDLFEAKKFEFKCVEIDEEKVRFLQKQMPHLQVLHQSFLDMEPPFEQAFSVVGNFPYNISSQILFKILEWFPQVEHIIGMFQKEVAKRVITGPGSKDYGVLSVLVQYYYDTEYLFDVLPESFTPPPKVDSGVIRLVRKSDLLPVKSKAHFKSLVKSSFAQRRKTLRNNLKGVLSPEKLKDSLFDRRAETLSTEEFAQLTFSMP